MNKPIKPNITIPESFAKNGVKTDFDSDLIAEGFDDLKPDVLAGDNLNKFIDDTYQGLNYGMAAADAINLINEGETLTVVDGKLTSGASGGGLEIGDIGIAPLGIDETKGKRRYLNGQVIIQDQYIQFTNKVKSAVALYPSLACTESEWQTTATMTVGGQVGKFVVDDEAGTIRLPKIIMPIQGLTDLSKLGEIVSAGLPTHTHTRGTMNITGVINELYSSGLNTSGAFTGVNGSSKNRAVAGNVTYNINFDASRSWTGSTSTGNYSKALANTTTVQQEQIQYPYFIQVATGAETEDNIINEIELNNPYSLGDSKYSPQPLNNLSWLKSEGQYNPKADYPSFYDWALINANNGVEGFALSTGEYTDYDVVINPADETFRLPLLDGSESLIGDERFYYDLPTTNGQTYVARYNGLAQVYSTTTTTNQYIRITNVNTDEIDESRPPLANVGSIVNVWVNRGDTFIVNGDIIGAIESVALHKAQGNGSLYFYVGETVQNANLINAGRIEETLVDKVDTNASNFTAEGKSLIAGYAMPSSRYIYLTLGASGAEYTAPANGYFLIVYDKTGNSWCLCRNISSGIGIYNTVCPSTTAGGARAWCPVKKNDICKIDYLSIENASLRFIYAQGSESEA